MDVILSWQRSAEEAAGGGHFTPLWGFQVKLSFPRPVPVLTRAHPMPDVSRVPLGRESGNPGFNLFSLSFSVLVVIVVLFVTLRRQKKEPLIVFEEEDVRENIITYDDEGGGEEDTEAFDIATLQNPDGINGFIPRKDIKPEYQYMPRPGLRPAPNSVDVDDFINTRIQEADNDPTAPPYDSIQIYGYEGRGSVAGSLSSLESATTDSDLDYDYLQNWGPRFKKLADLYGSKDTFDDDS